MRTIDDLLQDLIAAAPHLDAARREHLADKGEVLPHVLFSGITRWLVERGPLPEILGVLEHHLDVGDEYVQNVIAVSFLENLLGDDPSERSVNETIDRASRMAYQ